MGLLRTRSRHSLNLSPGAGVCRPPEGPRQTCPPAPPPPWSPGGSWPSRVDAARWAPRSAAVWPQSTEAGCYRERSCWSLGCASTGFLWVWKPIRGRQSTKKRFSEGRGPFLAWNRFGRSGGVLPPLKISPAVSNLGRFELLRHTWTQGLSDYNPASLRVPVYYYFKRVNSLINNRR